MRKYIFSFLAVFILISSVFTQDYPYKEVKFKNLKPVWIYAPIDSTIMGDSSKYIGTNQLIDDGIFSGRDHFIGKHDIPFPYVIKDGYIYFAHHTFYNTGEVDGALLEKINLKDGTVAWQQRWDPRNNDRQEWVEAIYVDDDGYLNVITDRRIVEPFFDIFKKFSLSGDSCLINRRKFDIKDGTLIENISVSPGDKESLRIKNSPNNTTILYPINNNKYQYYELNNLTGTISLYNIDGLGHLISDIIVDTVQFYGDVDLNADGVFVQRQMLKVSEDTLVTLDILKTSQTTDDEIQTIIAIYDKDMNITAKYQIDSLLPYKYNFKRLWLKDANKDYIYFYGEKLNQSIFDTLFYVIMDYNGNVLRRFTGLYNDSNHSFSSKVFIKEKNEYLLTSFSRQYYGLDFVMSTPYDSVKLYREFYFDDINYGYLPDLMIQLENGDIFTYGTTSYYNERYYSICPTMMRIKAEDLGFKTSIEKVLIKNKSTFSLYPNPVQYILKVDFNEHFTGKLEIIDILDKTLKIYKVQNEQTINLDVSSLNSGIYFIKIINDNKNKIYDIKRFIKN